MKQYFYQPGQEPWHYRWLKWCRVYRKWTGGVWIMEFKNDYSLGPAGPIRVWSRLIWDNGADYRSSFCLEVEGHFQKVLKTKTEEEK